MLNNDQIKLVQTAVRKAGIRMPNQDGRYYLLLGQYTQPNRKPVTSCKQLSNAQLDDILAICEAQGWTMPGKPETFYRDKVNQAADFASYAQQRAIGYLSEDLGMSSLHFKNFISYMTGREVDLVVSLTPKEAWKIIEALKAILKRKSGINFNSLKDIKDYYDKEGVAKDGKENQVRQAN